MKPVRLTALALILLSGPAAARELTPQWFSLELKGGAWISTDQTTKDFLGCCEPAALFEFGYLWKSRLGFEIGTGFMVTEERAVGANTGTASADTFSFLVIPILNSIAFRADFKEDQFLVPFVKAGPDYYFFRENVQGTVTKGMKYGLHGAGGLQILLDGIESLSDVLERDIGINDVYFVVEGRYAWVNSFGGSGLDLTHWFLTGGLLFEF